ncbi:DUF3800 domain-containing protein [Microbacterium sp. SYP-A9085]|uniref:DUF3800 domain-containing protein n=1 Tax=Microbacterium sp. SYP-A9085 TaxID=2664454 RepID=UPI00129B63FE|nr:DUF3800 domain-containing protein [Microbacterium sp. SYP-A9085]MRH29930.1 DUF3800 domain-containing protein [Microbacterium sp. SYP-A9085]
MRAVYIDESARGNDYYFFGALIVDDEAVLKVERGLNGVGKLLAEHVDGFRPRTEFHGSCMFQGNEEWKSVPIAWRVKASDLVAKILEQSGAEFIWRGIDLNALRRRYIDPYPPHLLTLAQILNQVDKRLSRLGDVGVVLADEHHSAATSRRKLVDFKIGSVPGYTGRVLTNLADTLYFGPSHASRLLQAADVATYFLNRQRTMTESDPRSAAAVRRIARRILNITVHRYIWAPQPTWR